MAKLSAVIIAKNAEDQIADCIDSVSFCDEVIVIDDQSTDRTAEIAKLLNAKVYQFIGEKFSEKRNYALRKIKGKWVLYIDVDERISPELRASIEQVIINDKGAAAAYRFQRKNFYLGNYEWPLVEPLERLFQKSALEGWYGDVHETAKVKGSIGDLNGFLFHYTHQTLTSMVNKTIHWSQIEANLRFKAGHPQMTWWRFYRVMFTGFYDSYVRQKGYKVGTAGLIESIYQGFSMFITYARLWEMQQNARKK